MPAADATAHNDLGIALRDACRPDEAMAALLQAAKLNPASAAIKSNVGSILIEKGRTEAGIAALEAAVRLEPRRCQFLYHLAEVKTFSAGDPLLSAMAQLVRDVGALPPRDQAMLHFALAKAYTDIGDHGQGFDHAVEANRIVRTQQPYDEAAVIGDLAATEKLFAPALMDSLKGLGNSSSRPIFIVGMPRCGSTLVAQVLGGHPQVFNAGEIDNYGKAVKAQFGGHPANWFTPASNIASGLTSAAVNALGRLYIQSLPQASSGAARVVDKYLLNFRYVGLIHLALPQARIIHVRRNAVDTCLSCFSLRFAGAHPYAYDLGELGRYYRAYDGLMDHWRKLLPNGAMLEVNYEDLVADLEGQARRVLDYCALPWDPKCLRFYDHDAWIPTSSAVQVRRPIYGTSVGRARFYGSRIAPLLAALEKR